MSVVHGFPFLDHCGWMHSGLPGRAFPGQARRAGQATRSFARTGASPAVWCSWRKALSFLVPKLQLGNAVVVETLFPSGRREPDHGTRREGEILPLARLCSRLAMPRGDVDGKQTHSKSPGNRKSASFPQPGRRTRGERFPGVVCAVTVRAAGAVAPSSRRRFALRKRERHNPGSTGGSPVLFGGPPKSGGRRRSPQEWIFRSPLPHPRRPASRRAEQAVRLCSSEQRRRVAANSKRLARAPWTDPAQFTVRVADRLVTLPPAFETVTANRLPLSSGVTGGVRYFSDVAPGIATPFFVHW